MGSHRFASVVGVVAHRGAPFALAALLAVSGTTLIVTATSQSPEPSRGIELHDDPTQAPPRAAVPVPSTTQTTATSPSSAAPEDATRVLAEDVTRTATELVDEVAEQAQDVLPSAPPLPTIFPSPGPCDERLLPGVPDDVRRKLAVCTSTRSPKPPKGSEE